MPCGRQASDTFKPLFSISPMMRMICSALCRFFMFSFCRLPCKTLIEKCPLYRGRTNSYNGHGCGRGGGLQPQCRLSIEKQRRIFPIVLLSTLNSQHSTLNTQHSTLNTQHSTLNTQLSTLNTQHSTLNTQHSTLNSQLSTLNSQLSTL